MSFNELENKMQALHKEMEKINKSGSKAMLKNNLRKTQLLKFSVDMEDYNHWKANKGLK